MGQNIPPHLQAQLRRLQVRVYACTVGHLLLLKTGGKIAMLYPLSKEQGCVEKFRGDSKYRLYTDIGL